LLESVFLFLSFPLQPLNNLSITARVATSRKFAGLRAGRSRFLGFDSRRGLGIFLCTTASRTALGPTQPLIQWVPWALSLGWSGRSVKLTTHLHLLPRSKSDWSDTFTPQIRRHSVVLS
jgi:hypothetical protein